MIERSWVWIPAGEAGEFSSPGSTFCADSFRYLFHPRVTAVACNKNPGHSAKSAGGRLQLNMYAPYVYGFAWSDMLHGCMVYTKTPRWQQFDVAPAMSALPVQPVVRIVTIWEWDWCIYVLLSLSKMDRDCNLLSGVFLVWECQVCVWLCLSRSEKDYNLLSGFF